VERLAKDGKSAENCDEEPDKKRRFAPRWVLR
jgi:hypothetical protein